MADVPTPIIVCKAEGHVALCPDCEQELAVKVTERKDPNAKFVLSRRLDDSQEPPTWVDDEVVYGTITSHNLSGFERHWRKAHDG